MNGDKPGQWRQPGQDEELTSFNQKLYHLLHLFLLSLKLLNEIHPQVLVILSPFGVQFSLENVEGVERGQKSCVQVRIGCERRLELRSQDENLGSAINVGLEVGVAWWWIDGLDRFVGSPEFLNPVVPLEWKQNTADI